MKTDKSQVPQLTQNVVVGRSEQLCGYYKCKNITADSEKLFCQKHLKQINS